MRECPTCHGEGVHDLRDLDAMLGEHLPDHVLRGLRKRDWTPVPVCTDCSSTGEVTEEQYAVIMAEAEEAVRRTMRELERRGEA